MRNIDNVLLFRTDLSPFLVHLTRDIDRHDARQNLIKILNTKTLKYGSKPISDARFGYNVSSLNQEEQLLYFSGVSFTETPLNEIHNLLEISGRTVDLKPYGLVFIKEKLKKKRVSPVWYINNVRGDKNKVLEALCSLIDKHPRQAYKILPFIAVFGKKLARSGEIDFVWEREWRYSSKNLYFKFKEKDVFIGLCPHEEIDDFEDRFRWLSFIDPRRNMKWYADKLLEAKKRSRLKYSVV